MEICLHDKCCGCGVCEYVCPRNAISMKSDVEGFLRPCIDTELCVECGVCERKCPVNKNELHKPLAAYAAYSKSKNIRERSSSGGLFAAVAQEVISEGGIVCGAAFDSDFRLIHKSVDKTEDLWALMGSKYVQSNTSGIFDDIKKALTADRKVLFCGTPCQCAAVKNAFADNEDLILLDFVCHGVPTPRIWEKYIKENFENVVDVSFRDKKRGWEEFSMRVETKDKVYTSTKNKDPYLRTFLQNYTLRPSCHNCSWKGDSCSSDITIGDFWGISKVVPSMNDNKGTSLMLVRSEKGRAIFEKIKNSIEYKETDIENTVKRNQMYAKSTEEPALRKEFFEALASDASFKEIAKRFGRPLPLKTRVTIKIKVIIKKLLFKIMK